MVTPGVFFSARYRSLVVSEELSTATLYDFIIPLLPMNPKTRININGNANPKTTEEGLRKMERKLAFEMASIALIWLYGFIRKHF
jgi:hypothetical protein